jgi:hypothetical protein
MSWIFDHVGLIVFFIVAFSFVRKVKDALRRAEEETARRGKVRPAANFDPEEARRVRKIQEEIRRKIAERRGEHPPARTHELPVPERPPLLRPAEAPPLDPLNGPMRRIFDELERRAQPPAQPSLPPVFAERAASQAAAVARQEELAEEYRVLQESRMLAARRVAHATVERKTREQSEGGLLTASRGSLLAELRDPRSLRRAFVLREVLSPPVGLR